MDQADFGKILRNWHIDPADAPRLDTSLAGSPDRVVFRKAITDREGRRWVLEEVAEKRYARKLAIAEALEALERGGLEFIHPYVRNSLDHFITNYAGHLFMLRPLVDGMPIDRGTWLAEPWRADAMATFLLNLRLASERTPIESPGPAFSPASFVEERMAALKRNAPDIASSLDPIYRQLKRTLPTAANRQDMAFCHGDFHPLNVVWGMQSMRSVIDWEFCGIKPEAYDAALLVGCIGFEDPDALIGPFSLRFIRQLRNNAPFAESTWRSFYDLVVAIRFAWLSEWIRTCDAEARDLEILYLNLLATQKRYVTEQWNL